MRHILLTCYLPLKIPACFTPYFTLKNAQTAKMLKPYMSILHNKRNHLFPSFDQFQQNRLNNEMKRTSFPQLPSRSADKRWLCLSAAIQTESRSRIGHWSNLQTISNDLLHTNETVFFTICPQTVACSGVGTSHVQYTETRQKLWIVWLRQHLGAEKRSAWMDEHTRNQPLTCNR